MIIGDFYGRGTPVFSFEFFPPKTEAAADDLLATAAELQELHQPDFISVTYGAGGSTRARTLELVAHIQNSLRIPTMAHLACLGHTRDEIAEIAGRLVSSGIVNILALRGDVPKEGLPADGEFRHATELIEFLRERFDVGLGAACYPEMHPQAVNPDEDLRWTQRKTELGARFLITQLFFDNNDYFAYVARARAAGITAPIVPGIMPITNVAQIERFTKMCGASIPKALHARLDRHRDDAAAVMAIGLEHAITQCRELLARGAPGLHFYTLNKSLSTRVILSAIKS
ncbi:MAG: methylenetetrahydrofolate reductase [NAD(P)H] [Acidobacteria bacterium]|nr:methylenetetrahydrofolate reductase [NAD(P)H] [Acidobacteriota bacterium]